MFRGKYIAALKELLPLEMTPALLNALYKHNWVVEPVGWPSYRLNAKQPFTGPESVVEYLGRYTHKIAISNQAMAGRSTRTFIKEGRWDKILATLKAGDYVMMQFGHNEGSKPDTSKNGYRGVLRGIGEDTVVLTWADGKLETVHSYGWYIRKFIRDAKEKGANPIVLSLIPRNDWKDGKVLRSVNSFGQYAAEVAKQEGAWFIDLNSITADKYDAMGAEKVKPFFPQEHTHTNYDGARINAASVTEGLQLLTNCSLQKYLLSH